MVRRSSGVPLVGTRQDGDARLEHVWRYRRGGSVSRSTLVTARNDGELIGGDLEVAIVQVHPIVVVRIVGDVVGGTDPLLKSVFETAMAVDVPSVEVDLEWARLFDSHGLAALEEACSAVLCRGRSLVLRGLGRGAESDRARGTGVSCDTSSGRSQAGVGVLAGLAR